MRDLLKSLIGMRAGKKDDRLIERFLEIWRMYGHASRQRSNQGGAGAQHGTSADTPPLLRAIREKTEQHNRNNVTRTAAYLKFYQQHPELHWALLAHMVSRNGGWSMTDVKGSLLQPVLKDRDVQSLFDMFERSNWLIFHDAYPQLLLYEQSVRRGEPLFHFLQYLGVSRFMEAVWHYFWREQDTPLLTLALIINEQQYIEKRIVQHPHYRRTVLQTAHFKMQTAFDFNQVVFPVAGDTSPPKLVGRTMHNFSNVAHRIKTGRLLYQILFHADYLDEIYTWAVNYPHTGSRADYWPQRFTPTRSSPHRVYSPKLQEVWHDVGHRAAETGDWFVGSASLSAVREAPMEKKRNFYVTDVYERSYRRLRILSLLARMKRRLGRLV